ncbi:teichoic acid biosynthesis protein F [Photobacterium sanctipauli]|uniref:Teichoic acid biosynthesis protein F n=1 Tax=Photobacterium sanctipauli TaxID=1342794 RepID=A0A2T3NTV7_9GAMM|nr:teichoic acid biosynthesis protein F [Photobacterium sanctipauli]
MVGKLKQVLASNDYIDLISKFIAINLSRFIFHIKYKNYKVDDKKIIFECFQGRNCSDSPLAIYNYIRNNYKGYSYIWVLNSKEHEKFNYITNQSDTSVVIYNSKEYEYEYATSKFWVVNCRLPFRFYKRKEQKYVQCWHGTPLKKLGCDIEVGKYVTSSIKGRSYSYTIDSERYDYFISPSTYASKRFCSGFNFSYDKIIELGYPRNDSLFCNKDNLEKINSIKSKLGIDKKKKVILYAPTWRDQQFSSKEGTYYFNNQLSDIEFLKQFDESYLFLFRGHYFSESLMGLDSFKNVSDYDDVNDLYLISDMLITDYSSVFFDYAILERPIFFYMYDRQSYEDDVRGFYLNIDRDLPGPIYTDRISLANAIKSPSEINYDDFNLQFNPFEDGNSAKRVVEKFL